MKPKEIKYISYFDFQDSAVARSYVTAATNKMESICESLNDIGYKVKIVSISHVIEPKFKLYKGRTISRNKNLSLKLFFSWGGNSKLLRQIKYIWHLIAFFTYLLLHTKKNEPVIVYHSLGYFNVILWAKKIRKFRLILEVEEIYQDVANPKFKSMARYEHQMFKAADAYIFPTELLNAKLNLLNKPYTIIYGTYKVEPQIVPKFDDGRIHVVYAGTFDPRKGGAAAAAAAAAFLPENYHLHICGFGNEKDTNDIKEIITDVSSRSKAKISYHGLLKGRDYIELIQKCHIGLSTQDPSAAFNATSFPSKILSYMANGLSVVSIDIPAIRTASIGQYLNYYSVQTPKQIAEAIKKIRDKDFNSREIITAHYKSFLKELNKLLNNLMNQ